LRAHEVLSNVYEGLAPDTVTTFDRYLDETQIWFNHITPRALNGDPVLISYLLSGYQFLGGVKVLKNFCTIASTNDSKRVAREVIYSTRDENELHMDGIYSASNTASLLPLAPFGQTAFDSTEQTHLRKFFPDLSHPPHDKPNEDLRMDALRALCLVQLVLNKSISEETTAEEDVRLDQPAFESLDAIRSRIVSECDSKLRETIHRGEILNHLHYIYLLVRGIMELYWWSNDQWWQLYLVSFEEENVRMSFLKQSEDGQEAEDIFVRRLKLPRGQLQIFVHKLRCPREDGGFAELADALGLKAEISLDHLQPDELITERSRCIDIGDLLG
jgi:hypothetical protein